MSLYSWLRLFYEKIGNLRKLLFEMEKEMVCCEVEVLEFGVSCWEVVGEMVEV